jgi:hypothetical protein
MKRFHGFRILRIFPAIIICSLFLVGCETEQSSKDLTGSVQVALNSTENIEFPGQLAVIKQGDLWVLEGGKELRLTGDGCNSSPAWSPDGQWLLFYKYDLAQKSRENYSLWVARADGGGVYGIETEEQVLDARWSPAANSIAYLAVKPGESVRSEEFKLADVGDKGPGEPLLLKDASEKIMNFCWYPTGNRLVYTTADENPDVKESPAIKVMPARGGEAETILVLEPEFLPDTGQPSGISSYPGGLKFSPNGHDLGFFEYPSSASLTADGVSLYITSIDGKDPWQLATMLAYPDWVDWYHAGDSVAYIEGSGREAQYNKRLSIMPVNRPDLAVTVTPEGYVDRDPAWSPEGDFIAVSRAKSSPATSQPEEWQPSSIWLAQPDGSGARRISDGDGTPGCFDCHPWWTGGGKNLMWARVQGEKASIWQAGADGENVGEIVAELDIPQYYYGAYKWDEVLAWYPGGFYHTLPFPGEQVRDIKSVGDSFLLIERVTSNDHDYYLDHPSFNGMKHVVSFIETAKFKEYKDGEFVFTARGGSDTGNYQFPYLLTYNPSTEELRREDPFLPLNDQEDIAFGKDGWRQILTNIEIQESAVVFSFKAAPGEVLAGGNRLPYTTVRYNQQSSDLVFSFLNVEPADSLKEKTIIESPGSQYVKEIRLEQLTGSPGDEQNPAQRPVVKISIVLTGTLLYKAETSLSGESIDGTNSCTVRFQ